MTDETERKMETKTLLRSFGNKTALRVAFVLLMACGCAGCASSGASRTGVPDKTVDSPASEVEVALGDPEDASRMGFPEGAILSAKRIVLQDSPKGGRALYADGGASLGSSNGISRLSGEKIRIAFGSGWNVRVLRGTLRVASQNVVQEAGSDSRVRRTYRVRPGDTLATLAVLFYDDANEWRTLANANRDVLKDGELREGLMLEIPVAGEPDVQVQIVGAGAR